MKENTYFDCLTIAGECAANGIIPKDEQRVIELASEIKENPKYQYSLSIALAHAEEQA